MTQVSSPKGDVGEHLKIVRVYKPDAVMMLGHNVEMVPQEQRTISIHTFDEDFTGYSSWARQDRGEEALVCYDAFTRYTFPNENSDEQIRDLSRQRDEEGLRRLRASVETGERP